MYVQIFIILSEFYIIKCYIILVKILSSFQDKEMQLRIHWPVYYIFSKLFNNVILI